AQEGRGGTAGARFAAPSTTTSRTNAAFSNKPGNLRTAHISDKNRWGIASTAWFRATIKRCLWRIPGPEAPRKKGEGCPGGIRTAAPTSGVWEQKDHRMGAEPQECPLHLVVATRSPLARPPRTAIAAVHRHRPQETKAPLPSPANDLR